MTHEQSIQPKTNSFKHRLEIYKGRNFAKEYEGWKDFQLIED